MDSGLKHGLIMPFTLDAGSITNPMVKESSPIRAEITMREVGWIARQKDWGSMSSKMETYIKDHGWMMSHQATGNSLPLMEVSTRDSSKVVLSTERECSNGVMDQLIKEIGGRGR
jgi:hypothetical protein